MDATRAELLAEGLHRGQTLGLVHSLVPGGIIAIDAHIVP